MVLVRIGARAVPAPVQLGRREVEAADPALIIRMPHGRVA
jgi:hypothetical protein